MFRHNLLLIYRNFKRYKSSFFINLIGLSTGIACTLLIYLWVKDELSFDKFHEKDSQLYQVMENKEQANDIWTHHSTSGGMAQALADEMPEVLYATATAWNENNINLSTEQNKNNNVRASGHLATNDFFKIFSYDLIYGDEDKVLEDKNAIVISEELAVKLFNTTNNVIGKVIDYQHKKQYHVSGIFKTIPYNSTNRFDFLLSFQIFTEGNESALSWFNEPANTYVVLKPETNVEDFNTKIADFLKVKTNNKDYHRTPFLVRYSDQYLYGNYKNGVQAGGRIEYVKLFSIIALFTLVIACINFMNLSTAQASRRIKEVGIKKAIGTSRRTLIFQYLGESMLMTSISMVVAVLLLLLFLPQFNVVTGKHLSFNLDQTLTLSILGITLVTGLVSGSYPALYISGFDPITVLKGKLSNSWGELWARKGLVIFQFVLSVILIVSVLVVYKQIEFVQTQNLGYNKDNIIWFAREGRLSEEESLETFLSELRKIPGIVNASSTGHDLTGKNWGVYGFDWEGKDPADNTTFEHVAVNVDMMETIGIEMKDGRTFSNEFNAENTKVVFNEAAIKHMGLKDPIGAHIKFWGNDKEIIGIAKDFHFESLHESIKPLMFSYWPQRTNKFMVKIKAGKEKETIDKIGKFVQAYNPGFSFDYKFLDDDYQAQYEGEKRVSSLSQYFAGLTILISCLGLFGLATFTAERKVKEISIRKVLGASVLGIFYLLTSDFIKIVFVAIVIALPLSYFAATHWLDGFAYRIELKWWYFLGAGAIGLLIAWVTVGMQAIRAAKVNPANSLRSE